MAGVGFDGVWKEYDSDSVAVKDLTIRVESGEFVVLVGPSGCGKTTSLRMLAGLEEITEGTKAGMSWGRVKWRNRWYLPTPSMLAASYMSLGIPANAPDVVMVMNENPIQMVDAG